MDVKPEVKTEPESPESPEAGAAGSSNEAMLVDTDEAEMKIEVKDEPLREVEESPADFEILTESLPATPPESDDDYYNDSSSDSDDYLMYAYNPMPIGTCDPICTPEQLRQRKEKEARLKQMPWCTCRCCVPTDDTTRQICCKIPQLDKLREKKTGAYTFVPCCVTLNDNFKKNIVDPFQLDLMRHEILMHNKDKDIEEKLMTESKAMYRYLAYRRFTHWVNCLTNMGEDWPIPIPSCVTRAVRIKFKEADKVYPRFSIHLPGEEHLIDFPA